VPLWRRRISLTRSPSGSFAFHVGELPSVADVQVRQLWSGGAGVLGQPLGE
jgi:hypothetical protein